jgi:hypothetical protein
LVSSALGSFFGRCARRALGVAVTAAFLGPAAGCYESTSLRLTVRSPPTTLDCARTADAVFFDAAYVRLNSVSGPDLFYTPRLAPVAMSRVLSVRASASALSPTDLGWGIGVWLKDGAKDPSAAGGSVCGFELEALTPEPGPGMLRRYVGQRGEPFDRTVRDMAQRLTEAFDAARPPG